MELIELEQLLWKANREGDGEFYARYLREDAFAVSKYGTLTKAEAVPLISANENPFVRTDLSDVKVIQLDDDNAIVTYRVKVVALMNGEKVDLPAYASTVWNRTGGEWRVVLHQQTALS